MATFQILPPRVPFIDSRNGLISREWYRFLTDLFNRVGGLGDFSLADLLVAPPDINVSGSLSLEPSLAMQTSTPVLDVAERLRSMEASIANLPQPTIDVAERLLSMEASLAHLRERFESDLQSDPTAIYAPRHEH
jgi:hypothetical protein